jgi:hypothetical protein
MQSKSSILKMSLIVILFACVFGCKKDSALQKQSTAIAAANKDAGVGSENMAKYDLEVVLDGAINQNGHIHFRQDPDPAKIITLDTQSSSPAA